MNRTQLSPQQTETMVQFQGITGLENVDESIRILQANDWDLNVTF